VTRLLLDVQTVLNSQAGIALQFLALKSVETDLLLGLKSAMLGSKQVVSTTAEESRTSSIAPKGIRLILQSVSSLSLNMQVLCWSIKEKISLQLSHPSQTLF